MTSLKKGRPVKAEIEGSVTTGVQITMSLFFLLYLHGAKAE